MAATITVAASYTTSRDTIARRVSDWTLVIFPRRSRSRRQHRLILCRERMSGDASWRETVDRNRLAP